MASKGVNVFLDSVADIVEDRSDDGEPNCGVIMNLDGSFSLFSTGIDTDALGATENPTPEQEAMIEMGRKLTGLALALSNNQIMAVLLDLAANIEPLEATN